MFMSAREIRDQYQAHDGDRHTWVGADESGVNFTQVMTDDEVFSGKYHAATVPDRDGHALYDDLEKNGVTHAISLQDDPRIVGSLGKPQILGGHHRVAVMHSLRPDDLMPVEHFRDVAEAKWERRGKY